jgi:hypothetical protein
MPIAARMAPPAITNGTSTPVSGPVPAATVADVVLSPDVAGMDAVAGDAGEEFSVAGLETGGDAEAVVVGAGVVVGGGAGAGFG